MSGWKTREARSLEVIQMMRQWSLAGLHSFRRDSPSLVDLAFEAFNSANLDAKLHSSVCFENRDLYRLKLID